MNEFSLIERYFSGAQHGESVVAGVGDDGAILQVGTDKQLVTSIDTLVSGVHFPQDAAPNDIARRALRTNLSDLAAMGASPLGFTLALTIPGVKEDWLAPFSSALLEDAATFSCPLVGGDTTAGLLTISIAVFGAVPAGQALMRSGAKPGDHIYVTGTLGDAAAALSLIKHLNVDLQRISEYLLSRFYQPIPRLQEGVRLRGIASSALDVSDGLLADLGHITCQSGVGAEIFLHKLPLSAALKSIIREDAQVIQWALTGGDDYELCFTVPEKQVDIVEAMISLGELEASAIGHIVEGDSVVCIGRQGEVLNCDVGGYQHFC
ncbi:MAG: thiamine-phosphate kinase [Pseudomonadales bacterium]|nr:thiamine-phosphate kinase [Pseudomonadales bacterium]MCP5170709.1 thiamine-phosphate kinase [Pseudomonadales bacterium]MCP5302050.1 thiamine-phosphate kinase [Pseudomonadales bacterium]